MPSAHQQVITLKPEEEHGALLAGRFLGMELRERVEGLAVNQDVVIDLSGVEMASPSFADEFFAKLDPALLDSGRVTLINSAPTLEQIIRIVQSRRGSA